MSFAHPLWLFALLALPLVALWMGWTASRRRKRLDRFAAREFWPTVAGSLSGRKRRIKSILRLCALAFFIVAAARPQWGVKERPLVREGSDLFICLDVSNSMLSRDIAPSRLASAKQQIRSLIYNLKGDRVGLLLFAGDAFIQCPLTLDYGLAVDLLESASPDSVSVQGTRIGVAIDTAHKAFDRSALGARSIILVTDGEDHDSQPIEAAKRAAEDGIVIECVGIGTTEGVPILLPNGNYMEDRQGRKVTSHLDVETLSQIARATGGIATVTGNSGNMALDSLYAQIKSFQKRQLESTEVRLLEDRFQWPLGVGVLLLALELFLGNRVRENGKNGRKPFFRRAASGSAAAAALFLALLVSPPQPARAQGWEFGNRAARLCQEGNQALQKGDFEAALSKYHDAQVIAPDNPVLDYNIGVALARQKKFDEARSAFQESARKAHDDPSLRAKAHYNAGLTDFESAQGLAQQKELDQAIQRIGGSIDANQKALDIRPDFGEAKQNLHESRQLLRQLVEMKKLAQQQPRQGDQKGNKDQKKQNQKDQKDQKQQQGQQGKEQKNKEDKQSEQKQGEQGKEGEKQEGEKQQQEQAATPTPTATPAGQQGERKKEDEKKKEEEQQSAREQEGKEQKAQSAGEGNDQQGEQAALGQMTREDAMRLLSTLPNEKPEDLQKALQAQQGSIRLEKNW